MGWMAAIPAAVNTIASVGSAVSGLGGGSEGRTPRNLRPNNMPAFHKGDSYDKHYEDESGYLNVMWDFWDFAYDNPPSDAYTRWLDAIETYNEELKKQPEEVREQFKPYIQHLANLGKEQFNNSQEIKQELLPRYEQVWNDFSTLGGDYKALAADALSLADESKAVRGQLQTTIDNAPTIGFGGQTFQLPANRQMDQMIQSIAGTNDIYAGLNNIYAGQDKALQGQLDTGTNMQNVYDSSTDSLTAAGNTVNNAADLQKIIFGTDTATDTAIMQNEEARRKFFDSITQKAYDVGLGQMGGGATGYDVPATDYSAVFDVIGDLLKPKPTTTTKED